MAVVLSWTSADDAVVTTFRDRLRADGYTVWEYRDQMHAGQAIVDQVVEALEKATVAIFCLSDAALKAGWMADELAWAQQNMLARDRPMRALIPARVGPMANPTSAQLARWGNAVVADLSTPAAFEQGYESVRLALTDLTDIAPVPVPAALFAMTADQYRELVGSNVGALDIEAMCRAAGMEFKPPVLSALGDRYGERSEDFTPFGAQRPLLTELRQAQERANASRKGMHRSPVALVWLTEHFSKPIAQQDQRVRKHWRDMVSLLVVDSVSALHPSIKSSLAELPQAMANSMILWVPPFTRHTSTWEAVIARATQVAGPLADVGDRWMQLDPSADVALDIVTAASTREWLRRALLGVSSDLTALPKNRAAMAQARGDVNIGPPFN